MDTPVDKTIRLSDGETEILMRALVEATGQPVKPKSGETQILIRQAEATPPASPAQAEQGEKSNFIL